ncbi:hypothetical protein [Kordia sp.]|uniref:hypothetical protein n=1 Tax=Kordia sp. TaxID=1965332 RepID=UPI003D6A9149
MKKNRSTRSLDLNKKSVSRLNRETVKGGAENTKDTCRRSVCVTCHTGDWTIKSE